MADNNVLTNQEPDEEYSPIAVDDLDKERVKLGRQGENGTQSVVIDANDWLVSLQGCCPLGLLPILGPRALVPAREQTGTLALLPEPPQAIFRHKILRPAKSHNTTTVRPHCSTGLPGKGLAL